jgi:hypothetical protein
MTMTIGQRDKHRISRKNDSKREREEARMKLTAEAPKARMAKGIPGKGNPKRING